jgi:hypothetical protein
MFPNPYKMMIFKGQRQASRAIFAAVKKSTLYKLLAP